MINIKKKKFMKGNPVMEKKIINERIFHGITETLIKIFSLIISK